MAVKLSSVVSLSGHRYGHDPSHYPAKAIRFIGQNPTLLKRVLCTACFGVTVAIIILVALFAFALQFQAELFGGGQWWSWVLAILVVLIEAALATALILTFTIARAQTEVFVLTMKLKGRWRDGEMSKPSVCKDLNPFRRAYLVRLITYPLNLLPVLGTAVYSAINATYVGWDYMDGYFYSIGMDNRAQRAEVFGEENCRKRDLISPFIYDSDNCYARFGFICAFIETLPVVGSTVFPLTNSVAAGLFACDIEKRGGPESLRSDSKSETLAPKLNKMSQQMQVPAEAKLPVVI